MYSLLSGSPPPPWPLHTLSRTCWWGTQWPAWRRWFPGPASMASLLSREHRPSSGPGWSLPASPSPSTPCSTVPCSSASLTTLLPGMSRSRSFTLTGTPSPGWALTSCLMTSQLFHFPWGNASWTLDHRHTRHQSANAIFERASNFLHWPNFHIDIVTAACSTCSNFQPCNPAMPPVIRDAPSYPLPLLLSTQSKHDAAREATTGVSHKHGAGSTATGNMQPISSNYDTDTWW